MRKFLLLSNHIFGVLSSSENVSENHSKIFILLMKRTLKHPLIGTFHKTCLLVFVLILFTWFCWHPKIKGISSKAGFSSMVIRTSLINGKIGNLVKQFPDTFKWRRYRICVNSSGNSVKKLRSTYKSRRLKHLEISAFKHFS